jgi:HSP20 family protein
MLATRFSTMFPPAPFSINRLTDALLGAESHPGAARAFPSMNVWETDEAVVVEAELPGFSIEDVDITMTGKEVTISGTRAHTEPKGKVFLRRERPTGRFSRTLRLSTDIDGSRGAATLQNGVLTVTLPKAEEARPRKIRVGGK